MGDGLDEEAGVVGNSPLGLQSAFSTLGAEYGYVPDSWLAAAFQDIPTPKDAAEADSDGDGYANWEEWVTGTDPKDAGSALRVTGLEVGADGAARVEWAPRAPGRKAVVVGAEALGGPWREDPGAGARFFRVRVSLE